MQIIGRLIKHIWNTFKRFISPQLFAVILCLLVVTPLLFGPVIHGYADNGDFWRVIYPNGLYPFATGQRSDYFNYLQPQYHLMQYYNEHQTEVYTSQPLFVWLAKFLNRIFYSRTIFDIRFLGGVYFVFFLGAIYLLTQALTHPVRRLRSYFIAALVVFVFADSSLTLYMNSFFAEPGGLIALLYVVAAILLISRKVYRHQWPLLLLYFVNIVLVISNKQQNAPLALSFALITAGFLFVKSWRKLRPYLLGGMAVVLLSGVVTYGLISKDFSDINLYQAFSYGTLIETEHPGESIQASGIDRQYALMRNNAYNPPVYATVLPTDQQTSKHLIRKITMGWLLRYYLKHPKQFGQLLDVGAKNLMAVQVRAVGDYPKSSGAKPQQQVHYFTGFSTLMAAFYPRKFGFTILLAITLIFVFSVGLFNDLRQGEMEGVIRYFLVAGLLSILIGVPIVSIIGSGVSDLAKHLFMAPMALEVTLVILVADALNGRLWHAYRKGDDEQV